MSVFANHTLALLSQVFRLSLPFSPRNSGEVSGMAGVGIFTTTGAAGKSGAGVEKGVVYLGAEAGVLNWLGAAGALISGAAGVPGSCAAGSGSLTRLED